MMYGFASLKRRETRGRLGKDFESRDEKVNEKVLYISVASITTRKKICVVIKILRP